MLKLALILVFLNGLSYVWANPRVPWMAEKEMGSLHAIPGGFSISCFSHHNSRRIASYFLPLINRNKHYFWWDTGTILLDSRFGYRKVMKQPLFSEPWFLGVYGGYDAYMQTVQKESEIYYWKHFGLEIGCASLGQLTINYYQAPKIPFEGRYWNFADNSLPWLSDPIAAEAITCIDNKGGSVKLTRALLQKVKVSMALSYSIVEKRKDEHFVSEGVWSVRVGGQYALHSRLSIQLEYILVDTCLERKKLYIGLRCGKGDDNLSLDMFQGRLKRPPEMYIPRYFDYKVSTNNDYNSDVTPKDVRPPTLETNIASGASSSNAFADATAKPFSDLEELWDGFWAKVGPHAKQLSLEEKSGAATYSKWIRDNKLKDIQKESLVAMDVRTLDILYKEHAAEVDPNKYLQDSEHATKKLQELYNCYKALRAIKEKKERLAL